MIRKIFLKLLVFGDLEVLVEVFEGFLVFFEDLISVFGILADPVFESWALIRVIFAIGSFHKK